MSQKLKELLCTEKANPAPLLARNGKCLDWFVIPVWIIHSPTAHVSITIPHKQKIKKTNLLKGGCIKSLSFS